jgi:putative acetyltransferase
MILREETPADAQAIHHLNEAAFATDAEAHLVDALRNNGGLTLSLVAELDGEIVGHIAFSPVVVTRADGTTTSGVGLAPMAVAPTHQRRGIGARLIAEGIARLRADGRSFCVVLGHAEYYPRHGFSRASDFGIRWEHPGTEEVFFVQALAAGGLDGVSGVVRYRAEFDGV